jgi:hypothetical protein
MVIEWRVAPGRHCEPIETTSKQNYSGYFWSRYAALCATLDQQIGMK